MIKENCVSACVCVVNVAVLASKIDRHTVDEDIYSRELPTAPSWKCHTQRGRVDDLDRCSSFSPQPYETLAQCLTATKAVF